MYPLGYALHKEGQVQANRIYQYNLKDHQGNTRAMYSKSAGAGQVATLMQSTNYDPFGKSFDNVANTNRNLYLYNGKEFQDQVIGGTQFGWYDYGVRFYDPEIGRWHSLDPSADEEEQEVWSPYCYEATDPIKHNAPDG